MVFIQLIKLIVFLIDNLEKEKRNEEEMVSQHLVG